MVIDLDKRVALTTNHPAIFEDFHLS